MLAADPHTGLPQVFRDDGLLPTVKDLAYIPLPLTRLVQHLARIVGVANHIGHRILGELPARARAPAPVVDHLGDVAERVAAGHVALEHETHRRGFLGHDDRGQARGAGIGVTVGGHGRVVQPLARPLPLGLLGVHPEDIDVVLVDGGDDRQQEATGRVREIELGLLDRGETDLAAPQVVEDGKGVVHRRTREP